MVAFLFYREIIMLLNTIDLEASGFGKGSYPIEIGYALDNGDIYCSLISPEQDWKKWDCSAENIHGITREILLEHGKSITQIAHDLNERLSGLTLYSDAWANDSSWLGLLYDSADIIQRFKIESIRYRMSEEQSALWHEVKQEVIESSQLKRHRASSDAMILQKTFDLLQARYQIAG